MNSELKNNLKSLLDRMKNDDRASSMLEADGDTLRDAIELCEENATLKKRNAFLRSAIDSLMLEYCPEDMGDDQIKRMGQQPESNITSEIASRI